MSDSYCDVAHTITDWWDGARQGIADLNGEPHYYECEFDETADDWSNVYSLRPVDEGTFRLAMEKWQLWLRWKASFDEQKTTIDTHPALPVDRKRYVELTRLLAEKLATSHDNRIKAKGDFKYGEPTLVAWTVVP